MNKPIIPNPTPHAALIKIMDNEGATSSDSKYAELDSNSAYSASSSGGSGGNGANGSCAKVISLTYYRTREFLSLITQFVLQSVKLWVTMTGSVNLIILARRYYIVLDYSCQTVVSIVHDRLTLYNKARLN